MIKFKIRTQFLTLLILTGLLPLIIVAFMLFSQVSKSMTNSSKDNISTIQDIRKRQLQEDVHRQLFDVYNFVDSMELKSICWDLYNGDFNAIEGRYDDFFSSYLDSNGFYNMFILDRDNGEILYNFKDEKGFFENSGLEKAWRKASLSDTAIIQDFSYFSPSSMESAFISKSFSDGECQMVVIFQITSKFISDVLNSTEGMGQTGESYLINYEKDTGAYEFRSDMVTMGNGEYRVGATFDEPLNYWKDAVHLGTKGGAGVYTDSIGNKVLVKFNKLDIPWVNWYLISKVDQAEVTKDLRPIFLIVAGVTLFLTLLIVIISLIFSGKLTLPITLGADFAKSISQGDFNKSLDINRRDELGVLARALKDMGRSLKEQAWIQMGKEGLDDTLRGEHNVKDVGYKYISFMVKHLDAQIGALYMMEEDGFLHLTSSYAFTNREGNFNKIALGEGLVGQAALEKNELVYTHVPTDAPAFNYGIADMIPTSYIVTPLIFENELLGVSLIGITVPVTKLQRKFISIIKENVAILLNGAKSSTIIQDLLEDAQKQQEELRVSNEELEQQTIALKESEKALQAQQEELRVTNEELEERTEALERQRKDMKVKNYELEEVQKDLEKKALDLQQASKYKSEFLANMSHELRTPLNSILILSQLIAKNSSGNLDEKQIKSAEAINSSGADLLKLINEILDLSKVEAGKVEINPEVMAISSLIEDIERVYRPTAEHQGTKFKIKSARDLPATIVTDSHRLQQILKNLLTNAFKFTDKKGGVTLDISRKDKEISFSVIDTGIGIPKEKQAAIFEAFQQADGSTSRKYGGTGLGLSISRELSRLLGGEISLKSEEGKGSSFTVTLPIKEGVVKKAIIEDRPTEEEDIQSRDVVEIHVKDDREDVIKEGRTLLIIEDDVNFATVLKEQAHERGFKVLIAEDGETGLHFADYYKPRAIILDIGLPGIDGWTVMERLKENPDLRHIPVHFMSGNDNKLPAMKMGAIGYNMKPVSLEGLMGAFEKIEGIISSKVHKLLIVEDDKIQRESIEALIDGTDIDITGVATGQEAYEALNTYKFDCIVLDLGLEDMSGYDLLDKIKGEEKISQVPIIIYTGRDLSQEEEQKLSSYAQSIIIKGAKSPERLLEETALFLHRVKSDIPENQREIIGVSSVEDTLKGKTILLVDDDMRNVFALSNILEEKSINIIVARDGLESLEKVKKHSEIDLVLMDIMMPRMDGYEAMGEIRKDRSKDDLPIIALTANAMKGDRNKCIDAGANDYLAKPVDNDKLLSMLRVWLY